MTTSPYPRLHFRKPLDEFLATEILYKGWYSGAVAELPNGGLYPLTFYDPVRLAQTLKDDFDSGYACFAEHALVVVPEVSAAAMQSAVTELYAGKWFDHLAPSTATTPIEALRLYERPDK